jgi:hypothetical protein
MRGTAIAPEADELNFAAAPHKYPNEDVAHGEAVRIG